MQARVYSTRRGHARTKVRSTRAHHVSPKAKALVNGSEARESKKWGGNEERQGVETTEEVRRARDYGHRDGERLK
eukprot:5407044-Pleurochrysis_carterae.AAC.1